MTDERHTPTPWFFIDDGEGKPIYITADSAHCGDIADLYHWVDHGAFRKTNAKANAAIIVRAVNSHTALVEALNEARTELKFLVSEYEVHPALAIVARIDAALSLAQEETGE